MKKVMIWFLLSCKRYVRKPSFMVILLMPHCQPLLHEFLSSLGVHPNPHGICWRRSIVAKNLTHLM